MTAPLAHALYQAGLGALAAAGFGVLFNAAPRPLAFCAAGGALALALRTLLLDRGWSLEAASFAAAMAVTLLAAGALRRWLGSGAAAVAVAACIPMVPGAPIRPWPPRSSPCCGWCSPSAASAPASPSRSPCSAEPSSRRVVRNVMAPH